MRSSEFLMIPGPTPLPEAVRVELARPAIGHRGAEFKAVLKQVLPGLQWLFQTTRDVLLYTASGTGAMEAALVNTLNPGDEVLVLSCGVFSQRWVEIAKSLGLRVEVMSVPPGEANSLEGLKERLAQDTERRLRAVLLTHSETSTGVLNPVQAMCAVIRAHGALSIVDVVTSLGATAFYFDDWQVDIAISGSQKGFMLPPGLSFLALSERAWQAHQACVNPGYYFNFTRYRKAQAEFTTPYTPATPLILALKVALEMMREEGLEAIWSRHARLQAMTRAGAEALGLSLLVPELAIASPAVTPIRPPGNITVDAIRAGLKEHFSIVVADGQKELKGNIFRIGHLGYIFERDVLMTLASLEVVLTDLGHAVTPGAAVAAARLRREACHVR